MTALPFPVISVRSCRAASAHRRRRPPRTCPSGGVPHGQSVSLAQRPGPQPA
jgi:hypothetical protein